MRFLPHTDADRRSMLARIGVAAIDDLFVDIPRDKLGPPIDLPTARSEIEVERILSALAAKNVAAGSVPFFLGAGAYRHHVPASVDHLIQRSEFLTSYTPYQPEIAQGTLQVLFEFQTQVANLTAMEVANASMYDGSTATAEAVVMAHRIRRRRKAVLAGGLHPHYRSVVETISRMAGDTVTSLAPDPAGTESILDAIDAETSCVVVQSPSFYGHLIDLSAVAEKAHAVGALTVAVFTEVVALGAIEPPGAQGADIVVGEGQSLGNPLAFGGPYVGLFATRQSHVRQMPGRLAGETVDAEGRRGFVLTLSTREQHIRREKATSNICTNSGLCALAFSIHMALLGETGLRRLAALNHANAVRLAESLSEVAGVTLLNDSFFNEFTVRVPGDAATVIEKLAGRGVLAGVPVSRLEPDRPELSDLIVVAATEMNTDADRAAYASALREVL
ncbi:MAG: aminomethyl-transferring glycine dehydrogenase subunit GcvPA [Bauldia sp.]